MFSGRLLETLLTNVDTGRTRISEAPIGVMSGSTASGSRSSRSSHMSQRLGGRITGMRVWIEEIASFERVVMIEQLRSHSSVVGSFHEANTPAKPIGRSPVSRM